MIFIPLTPACQRGACMMASVCYRVCWRGLVILGQGRNAQGVCERCCCLHMFLMYSMPLLHYSQLFTG